MPGQPGRAHARIRFPPGDSPSRTAGLPPASPQSSLSKNESVHASVETLCGRSPGTRNRKTVRACAEAVKDETSLWKAEENHEGSTIQLSGVHKNLALLRTKF